MKKTLLFCSILLFSCVQSHNIDGDNIKVENKDFYYYQIKIYGDTISGSSPLFVNGVSKGNYARNLLNSHSVENLISNFTEIASYSPDIVIGYNALIYKTKKRSILSTDDFEKGVFLQDRIDDNSSSYEISFNAKKMGEIKVTHIRGLFWKMPYQAIGKMSNELPKDVFRDPFCYILKEIRETLSIEYK